MFRVAFQLVAPLTESETSREFLQMIEGEIRDTESNVPAGRISALIVQVGRVADAGEHLFDVMDGESSELGEYHAAFFNPHRCDYKDSIRRQFVDIYGLDLLIINYVEIEPALRKRGLGLLVVSKTIDVFGENCGLIAMKPFPLQFRNYLDPGWLPPAGVKNPKMAFLAATRKLRDYWGHVGFKRVKGTDYCALSPANKRPSLKGIRSALEGLDRRFQVRSRMTIEGRNCAEISEGNELAR
jgi:hypothetical protein